MIESNQISGKDLKVKGGSMVCDRCSMLDRCKHVAKFDGAAKSWQFPKFHQLVSQDQKVGPDLPVLEIMTISKLRKIPLFFRGVDV